MNVPPEVLEQEREAFLQRVARLKASPEELARILASGKRFDYYEWLRETGPSRPEDLAEMEEFLREREEERKRNLAAGAAAAGSVL